MGVMTKYLLDYFPNRVQAVELDQESTDYLSIHYPALPVLSGDFLKMTIDKPTLIIGNFPYNISSQILFHALDFRENVPAIGGMFQKEMAARVAASHGNKDYGILSVLMQSYYDVTYCFTVDPHVFQPPPKVKSGVITCIRKENAPDLDFDGFRLFVKAAFNQRRKTTRNALKLLGKNLSQFTDARLDLRAEQISVASFQSYYRAWKQHQSI